MMHHRNWGQLGPVDKLKNIHANQHLSNDNQHIAHGDHRVQVRRKRRVEGGLAKSDGDKWICGDEEDDELGNTGNMVIDKTTAI